MNIPAVSNFTRNTRPAGNARGCLRIAGIVSAVLAGIWVVMGLLFVCIGIGMNLYTAQFAKTARSAEGVVIGLEQSSSGSGASWCPVIEFDDHHGDTYLVQLNTCSGPPRYLRGEEVSVLYAEDDPKHAKINDSTLYWFGYIFAGTGGVFAVLGGLWLAILFFARKHLRKKARSATTVS